MAFYRLSKLPFASPQTSKTLQTLKHRPSRHPRAKATSRTGTPGPRPQQWLSMGFQSCRYGLSKLPFARPQTLQTFQNLPNPSNPPKSSKPPNTVPSRHPRAKATSRTGTPGPRPQQWLSMGFQSCRCQPANPPKPSKTLQTLQTPSPAGTPGPRPLPQQWLFIGFQGCRLPARKPSKTLQNPPNPPNTVPAGTPGPRPLPNRHPRAKATAMAFYGLSKLPFASPQTLQNPPNPPKPSKASKPSKTLQTLQPSKHLPKPSKPSKTFQNPPNTFPTGTPVSKATSQTGTPRPRPQQWLSMGFQSCRLPARKPSKTFQNPPNTVPAGTQGQGHFPNRHPRAKAIAIAAACVRPIRLVLQEKAQWDGSRWTP